VNILLLSAGGGGGNILRSLKTLFRRDVLVTQKTDVGYADRLRRAITWKFLDTNEFSLTDVPDEERLVIGAATTRRVGSMHNPELARQALEESKQEVESLLSEHSVVIVVGTGGKGTGAGTVFPIAQMARQQKKLVIPIFVRPSFERHEVEKRRYDHALRVVERFDAAGIRLTEILNDRGYRDADPQSQLAVWERMNLPIARGLRGLLYVLWDLSQVDPSDLSILFAGHGRLRIGFAEIDPQPGHDPTDEQIDAAVRGCWDNPYCAFDGVEGTSLVCIQGHWSNVVDGKIKGQLAARALRAAGNSPYNPLYARALPAPRPWGVTTLFAEYTGNHPPLEIDWTAERKTRAAVVASSDIDPIACRVFVVLGFRSSAQPIRSGRPCARRKWRQGGYPDGRARAEKAPRHVLVPFRVSQALARMAGSDPQRAGRTHRHSGPCDWKWPSDAASSRAHWRAASRDVV
jgi:cell division GTPase FtsZ